MAVPQRRDHPLAGWFDQWNVEPLYMFGAAGGLLTIVEYCLQQQPTEKAIEFRKARKNLAGRGIAC